MGTGPLGVLTARWVRAELDDRMRLNSWSTAASYDTARIFADLGFGAFTASGSIISRPRRRSDRVATNVRCWHKANMTNALGHVRFQRQS